MKSVDFHFRKRGYKALGSSSLTDNVVHFQINDSGGNCPLRENFCKFIEYLRDVKTQLRQFCALAGKIRKKNNFAIVSKNIRVF